MTADNIIDSQHRFLKPILDEDTPSLEAALRACPRVLALDRPILARNLGRLAARLNSDRPQAGAKAIYAEAGESWSSQWIKRKRFIRLPDEAAPAVDGEGDYGASGSSYVTLAKAAGKLLADSRDETVRKQHEERAVRGLLLGTSFLPNYQPPSLAEQNAASLLVELSARLTERIAGTTRLLELWKLLDSAPFEPASSVQKEFQDIAAVPEALRKILDSDWHPNDDKTLFFSDIGCSTGVWHMPFLNLGTLLLKRKMWVFRIPRRLGKLFSGLGRGKDPPPELTAWLESLGHVGSWPPPIDYDPLQDFGWSLVDVDVIHRVMLQIAESSTRDCAVELKIETLNNDWDTNLPDILYNGPIGGNGQGALRASARMDRVRKEVVKKQCGSLCYPYHGEKAPQLGLSWPWWMESVSDQSSEDDAHDKYIRLVIDMAQADGVDAAGLDSADGQADEFIGYVLPCADEGFAQSAFLSGWVDDPTIAELVLEASDLEFFPTFAVPEKIPAPAAQRSIAAAILRNLAGAATHQRIDTMLIERADLIAKAGLGYHERLMQFHRERLQHPS